MVDEQIVIQFHGELKMILDKELEAGNKITETWHGDWTYKDISAISLKDPFKTRIQRNLDDIVFRNINDPHYWKAEYFDSKNKLLLVCGFGSGKPDFSEL